MQNQLPGKYEYTRISQKGDRKINQDRCEVFEHDGITLLLLADGMGGHPKGEVAAQLFIDTAYHQLKNETAASFNAEQFIESTLKLAHKNIVSYGKQQKPPIYPRTTAVIVIIVNGFMQWSHLGDSRTYLFRQGQPLKRTLDHTRVEAMRLAGQIEDSDSQSEASGRSGVSKCLGGMKKIKDVMVSPPTRLQQDDLLLLCSDGVWSQLKEADLNALILEDNLSLGERTTNLVDAAVKTGHPKSDNATALTLTWNMQLQQTASQENKTENAEIDSALDNLRNLIGKYQ